MALFRANLAGEIQQLLITQFDIESNPSPGPGYELFFDPTTNAGVIAAYNTNSAAFAMPGGTLTQDNVPVTINPPSLHHTALQNLPALIVKLQNNDAFTTSELKQLLTVLLHHAGHI